MMQCIHVIFLVLGLLSPAFSQKDWWEDIQLYQIYPRSYMDSDGDGIGDLKGVTMKLDHLKELGIQAAWLSPIFLSPMVDFGYDISNFTAIQPEYGTMDDFVELTNKAKELGIKIILDYVPNHSSDKHVWFELSANRTEGYEDFYLWDDGKPDPKNPGKMIPSNNWNNMFRGSAWTWNEKRKQFYFHQFHAKQPDLNFREPRVVEEMKDVLRFWLDKGASGFRVDAVPHLFETDRNRHGGVYPDEPLSGNNNDPDDYEYLKHIYSRDQPETYDMVVQWRQILDEYQKKHGGETKVMMIEAYGEIEETMKYFGNITHPGAHFPFNFNFIMDINKGSNAAGIKRAIDVWDINLPGHIHKIYNWVIGNHDNRRVATRYGAERVDGMTMLLQMLPGIAVTYQGDEIGMEDQWLSWEDTVDPQACNTNPRDYEPHSRDPERTPFQWDDTKNAGFSKADKTWLPVATNYKHLNLKAQKTANKSHFKVYQQLSKLRRESTLKDGSMKVMALSENVLGLKRELPGHDTFVVLLNLANGEDVVNLNEMNDLPSILNVEISNIDSAYETGDRVATSTIYLEAYDSLVLRGEHDSFDKFEDNYLDNLISY